MILFQNYFILCRFYSKSINSKNLVMKYLSVAEKNDAAKTIAGHLSRGTARRVSPILFEIIFHRKKNLTSNIYHIIELSN